LQDKKRLLARDLENNKTLFERDSTRLNGEVEKVKFESKQAQKDSEKLELELTKI
jgi:hypothetical protein